MIGWKLRQAAAATASVAALALSSVARAELPPPVNAGELWRITRTEWSDADESGYARFVQTIGRSTCSTLESCLAISGNPYFSPNDPEFTGDCADMVYVLRAYYAWKNGLPFTYQNAMRTFDGAREDLRYSANGNRVAGRRDAIGQAPIKAGPFIARIGGEVSTAMFRTHPDNGDSAPHDDFFPVAVNREAVRPGVLAYDIYGHVGIVYDILDDGRVLLIASHPDRSVTRTTYGPNFLRSKPDLGAGLKGWRPIRLEGARLMADGHYIGGRDRAAKNEEIPHYSMEQFLGNRPDPNGDWRYGDFVAGDRSVDYYDFVRRKLAGPGFRYNPVTELRNGMQTVCGAARDRKVAVERAVSAGFPKQKHPERLPPNIYGTYGPWEGYSTPSRDARLKVSFIELKRTMKEFFDLVAGGDLTSVHYEGEDLAGDLWTAYIEEKEACTYTYWRSDNSRVRLNLGHLQDRLWELSFDPFHCAERRWGASGPEFQTCTDDDDKARWYGAQRWLRYQAERTYDVRMDFTAAELKSPAEARPEEGGLGVEAPADADLRGYLASINSFSLSDLPDDPEIVLAADTAIEPEPRLPAWHSKILNGWND